MPLPRIDHVYFKTNLSSSGKEIEFRPFTIGEQKKILLIKENSEEKDTYEAIAEMVQSCVKTKDVEVLDLYVVDFEKLFYDMKSVSDGNILPFVIKCPKCETKNNCEINTREDFHVEHDKNFSHEVTLKDQGISISVRQPTIRDNFSIESKKYENDDEKALDLMVYCIDKIKQGETVYKLKDFSFAESKEFFESLPDTVLSKLTDFFGNMPYIDTKKKYICSNNECKHEIELSKEDIKSFL